MLRFAFGRTRYLASVVALIFEGFTHSALLRFLVVVYRLYADVTQPGADLPLLLLVPVVVPLYAVTYGQENLNLLVSRLAFRFSYWHTTQDEPRQTAEVPQLHNISGVTGRNPIRLSSNRYRR